jgi:hypothetical protein
MKTININAKSYEEVKIGSGVYKVDLSNTAFERYSTEAQKLADDINKSLTAKNFSFKKVEESLKDAINLVFVGEPY